MIDTYDLSVGVFVRGLKNLKTQLAKAQDYAAASGIGEAALLDAQLASENLLSGNATVSPADLHMYTLAAQVHWAAEGAKLAVSQLLGTPLSPDMNDAKSFADLHQRLDATIVYMQEVAPDELEAGLGRTIVIENRRGSTSAIGSQFLLALAIPHFFYHMTCVYGILRNQGVQLTMGDFLGNWGTP